MTRRIDLALSDPRAARRAVIFWTTMIVGLLSLQVALCFVGVYCAMKGRGVVVESDYYNKALHWDEKAALLRASAQLGWNVDLTVGDVATTRGDRPLMLTLKDKDGSPIRDASVNVAFFHHARPLELRRADLAGASEGVYVSSVPLNRRGIWEFRLTIHRGEQTFVETLQRDLFE